MKSVYSVILRDELVKRLDSVAYQNGVSRSVMLNKILADYLCMETPDTVMESIFSRMEAMFSEIAGMRFINQASGTMASVTSALEYRYNPKVKYSLELFPAGDLGQLKISLRSQNPTLIALLEDFYSFIIYLEGKYIGERAYFYGDERFVRVLVRPEGVSADGLGEAIAKYVRRFDGYLRKYFSGLADLQATKIQIEADYALTIGKEEVRL
ncbi:MAG: hypothetical protein IKA61_07145 [Clostridia bacterium]|nr:hypothetical protein [Clostridia bacterium]